MGLFSGITNAVGNLVESTVSAVGNVANVVVTTIDGGSTSDALGKLAADGSKAYSASLDVAALGQGDKLDAVSGGLFSASKNIGTTPQNLIEGKSVRQNLEDAGRVGAVVASGGTWGVGTAVAVNAGLTGKDGKSQLSLKSAARAVGNATGGGLGNILKAVGNESTPQTRSAATQSGYYSDTPTSIDQSTGKSSYVVPIIIILTVSASLLLIKKKK